MSNSENIEYFAETVELSLNFPVTIETPKEGGKWEDPTVPQILEEALNIVRTAPGFDWLNTDREFALSLVDIEGVEVVDAEIPFHLEEEKEGESADTVRAHTIMSGTVHSFIASKQHDDEGIILEKMVQGGETYQIYSQDQVPNFILSELEARYGESVVT